MTCRARTSWRQSSPSLKMSPSASTPPSPARSAPSPPRWRSTSNLARIGILAALASVTPDSGSTRITRTLGSSNGAYTPSSAGGTAASSSRMAAFRSALGTVPSSPETALTRRKNPASFCRNARSAGARAPRIRS